MTYFVDFSEMDTKELREEFCRMKTELLTLTEFLVANFGNDIRAGDGVPSPSSVEVAMRLLGELKKRRVLAAAKAELVRLKDADNSGIEAPHLWVAPWDEPDARRQRIEELKAGLAELIEAMISERPKGEEE